MTEQKRHLVAQIQLLTLRLLFISASSGLRGDKSPAKLC